jgi:undecaprenyl diphosphate synthase
MGLFKKWFQVIPLSSQSITKVPLHLAIIMDGNGRWASKRGLPRSAGHRAGMERVRETVEICLEVGVKYLTLYAFSTENWRRPVEEVNFLMDLFEKSMKVEVAKLHQHKVRVCFIGLRQGLSPTLIKLMEESQDLTKANDALTLNIAINYGGRSEIVVATQELLRAVMNHEITPEGITEDALSNRLFTSGQPDPDLLIRPGGERRISNMLIWQSAYTELYFSDLFWPDFGKEQILKALHYYSKRERRFGRVEGAQHDV